MVYSEQRANVRDKDYFTRILQLIQFAAAIPIRNELPLFYKKGRFPKHESHGCFMDYILDCHSLKRLPSQYLSVIQCGKQICMSGHFCDKKYYFDHSLTFVIKGKGTYYTEYGTFEVTEGNGFAIFPGTSVSYRADTEDPWQYYYVIINGKDCSRMMREIGLSHENPVFTFQKDDHMMHDLKAIHEASRDPSRGGYDVTGYFLLLFSRLYQSENEKNPRKHTGEMYCDCVVRFIQEKYPYNITVGDIAYYLNIDRTYLYRTFRRFMGVSISTYLNDFRTAKVLELLRESRISISEAAISCGFYDFSHFNRYFASKYHMTPGQYRKTQMNE